MLKYFVLFAALLLCYSSYELKISFLSEIVRNMKHLCLKHLFVSVRKCPVGSGKRSGFTHMIWTAQSS